MSYTSGILKIWHSSIIRTRVNSRTLETFTGSIYHLDGELNSPWVNKDVFGSVMENFNHGFPENWIELLQLVLNKNQSEYHCVVLFSPMCDLSRALIFDLRG
jgi:hypothetical protein